MLGAKLFDNPDKDVSIVPRRICQQFAQVIMIGSFELILNHYGPIARKIVRQDVQRKGANFCFAGLDFKVEA